MEKESTVISVLSYKRENSENPYTLEGLGNDFEIEVPPENIAMALCAHHKAVQLIESGVDAKVITVGGCARSNKDVVERISQITGKPVYVEANTQSSSTASNLESLSDYSSDKFIIVCQNFAKFRAYIHGLYHLEGASVETLPWEKYGKGANLGEWEQSLLEEVAEVCGASIVRKLAEGILVPLAVLDPHNGGVKLVANIRAKLREENLEEDFLNKL